MKRITKTFITLILLLALFVSCAQDTTVFKSIVHSNPKSKYKCSMYIGQYGNRHYMLTKNNGVVSFLLSSDGSSAYDIIEESTGSIKAIDSATIKGDYLYVLDRFGKLVKINLTDGTLNAITTFASYQNLSNGYVVNSAGSLYAVDYQTTSALATGITKVVSKDYFKTSSAVYKDGSTYINTDKKVVNITDKYAVVLESGYYNVYSIEGSAAPYTLGTTKLATLSGEPTASFIMTDTFGSDKDKIAYKTKAAIDIFDGTSISSKTNGWATNLYTDTTEIDEFVTINGKVYSVNATGGMMLITANTATQIFSK